jgi:ubiquinone/menaquinone biosynthesis C-methylase UbiE
MKDATEKFTNRADNYNKYRPDYPKEILGEMRQYGIGKDSVIADIGSGTGKLTQLFIENGNRTFAVEPNDDMRRAADALFAMHPNYIPVKGTAENTTLREKSIDCVTAAQAFHWFDPQKTMAEFKRILKDNGVLALVWNTRKTDAAFPREYESIIQSYSERYNEAGHRDIHEKTIQTYFDRDYRKIVFPHHQKFDFDGIIGRYLSASYAIQEGTGRFEQLAGELKTAFQKHKEADNTVRFNYDTELYIGRITAHS